MNIIYFSVELKDFKKNVKTLFLQNEDNLPSKEECEKYLREVLGIPKYFRMVKMEEVTLQEVIK